MQFFQSLPLSYLGTENSANSLRVYIVQDYFASNVMQNPELMLLAYFKTN